MSADIVPRYGLRFEHATLRQARPGTRIADCPPEVCRVTAVRKGTVYYRGADGEGAGWRVSVDYFRDIVARVLDEPEPTPEEIAAAAHREHQHQVYETRMAALVRVSFGYSCGCTTLPGEPTPHREVNPHAVGGAIICDYHDEYAVVVRETVQLVDDEATLRRILIAADVDPDSAAYVAADQNGTERAKRRAAGRGTGPS